MEDGAGAACGQKMAHTALGECEGRDGRQQNKQHKVTARISPRGEVEIGWCTWIQPLQRLSLRHQVFLHQLHRDLHTGSGRAARRPRLHDVDFPRAVNDKVHILISMRPKGRSDNNTIVTSWQSARLVIDAWEGRGTRGLAGETHLCVMKVRFQRPHN